MTDREKVIERLQRVSSYFKSMLKVGYDGDAEIYREHRESIKMAIELLKEQEEEIENLKQTAQSMMEGICLLKKQEPKQVIDMVEFFEGMKTGKCPSCARSLVNINIDESKFCKYCGQAVKWNE